MNEQWKLEMWDVTIFVIHFVCGAVLSIGGSPSTPKWKWRPNDGVGMDGWEKQPANFQIIHKYF
jgi:hypothetical protein